MTRKKIKLLSNKPLIWFHYVLLVGIIFLAHYLSDITGVEALVMTNGYVGWAILFVWYYAFVSLGDQLIHNILQVD